MNAGKLKPKSGKNARPDHVGDDQNSGGKKAYRLFLISIGRPSFCRLDFRDCNQSKSRRLTMPALWAAKPEILLTDPRPWMLVNIGICPGSST